jgi:hypothetical protein
MAVPYLWERRRHPVARVVAITDQYADANINHSSAIADANGGAIHHAYPVAQPFSLIDTSAITFTDGCAVIQPFSITNVCAVAQPQSFTNVWLNTIATAIGPNQPHSARANRNTRPLSEPTSHPIMRVSGADFLLWMAHQMCDLFGRQPSADML